MNDFSIEMAAERISDSRTKKYFAEVMQCYNGGSFRSAVVMLWSVAVCDLLFKLDELSKAYGDSIADQILASIEKLRVGNPKSPEWEWALVEEVSRRTSLLEPSDHANLKTLQEHRHLSAHPVLTSTEALYSPSKEQVRAHIRNVLDGVLTKPAIFTRKVFDALTEDLEAHQAVLPDQPSLRRYLEAKYFPHFLAPLEDAVFRSLWRLVFRSLDPRCESSREINYRALCILYERRPVEIRAAIQVDRGYFSDIEFTGTPAALVFDFLTKHPQVFIILTDAAKAPLTEIANSSLSSFSTAWFLSPNVSAHLVAVEDRVKKQRQSMSAEAFESICRTAEDNGCLPKAFDIGIGLYTRSINFNAADGCFHRIIKPIMAKFSTEQLVDLLHGIEENPQTYGRGKAKRDHQQLKQIVDTALAGAFDPAQFPHFMGSIED